MPPNGNANYAWIQHFIYHLSPSGIAGFVMANGSLSSNSSGEGEIRSEAEMMEVLHLNQQEKPIFLTYYGEIRERIRKNLFTYYRKGEQEGDITLNFVLFQNGQLKNEDHLKLGSKHGVCKSWFEDGAPETVATYELGILISKEVFNQAGEQTQKFELRDTDGNYQILLQNREREPAREKMIAGKLS